MRNKLFYKYPISSVKICLKVELLETAMRAALTSQKATVGNTDSEECCSGCAAAGAFNPCSGNGNGTPLLSREPAIMILGIYTK